MDPSLSPAPGRDSALDPATDPVLALLDARAPRYTSYPKVGS